MLYNIQVVVAILLSITILSCGHMQGVSGEDIKKDQAKQQVLFIKQDKDSGTISIYKSSENDPILIQNARQNERPYIHPIIAPDGKGVLTQYRPSHHIHQTGLFWGFKRVNERDYFMKWQGDYWRKVSDSILKQKGTEVQWLTTYDLLDENGNPCLSETATWTLQMRNGKYLIDIAWEGKAKTDITFGKFYVGGLFLRMPWFKGIPGEVVNANGQRNLEAEAQRAIWTDVGMAIEDQKEWAHVAILDHPQNKSFPITWRVDNELGIGPSRQIAGDWKLKKGESELVRYRLIVYTGSFNHDDLMKHWKEFCCAY